MALLTVLSRSKWLSKVTENTNGKSILHFSTRHVGGGSSPGVGDTGHCLGGI
jgi:hypothetical protein